MCRSSRCPEGRLPLRRNARDGDFEELTAIRAEHESRAEIAEGRGSQRVSRALRGPPAERGASSSGISHTRFIPEFHAGHSSASAILRPLQTLREIRAPRPPLLRSVPSATRAARSPGAQGNRICPSVCRAIEKGIGARCGSISRSHSRTCETLRVRRPVGRGALRSIEATTRAVSRAPTAPRARRPAHRAP